MPKAVRSDLGKPVAPWFKKLKPEMKAIADTLHELITTAAPQLKAEIKWGMPHYTKNSMVCALMGAKRHVSLFFHRGKLLKDPKKRLHGSGKTVRSIKFTSADQIPAPAIKAFVKAAAAIDAEC
jgi:hypothetical protein